MTYSFYLFGYITCATSAAGHRLTLVGLAVGGLAEQDALEGLRHFSASFFPLDALDESFGAFGSAYSTSGENLTLKLQNALFPGFFANLAS